MATATLQIYAMIMIMAIGVILTMPATTDKLVPNNTFFMVVGLILMILSMVLLLIEMYARSPKHPATPIWR